MHAFYYWYNNIETLYIFPSVVLSLRRSKIRIHKVGKQELTWKVYSNKVNLGVIYLFYLESSKFFL